MLIVTSTRIVFMDAVAVGKVILGLDMSARKVSRSQFSSSWEEATDCFECEVLLNLFNQIAPFGVLESECGICPVHHHCIQGACVCMSGFVCQGKNKGIKSYIIHLKLWLQKWCHIIQNDRFRLVLWDCYIQLNSSVVTWFCSGLIHQFGFIKIRTWLRGLGE